MNTAVMAPQAREAALAAMSAGDELDVLVVGGGVVGAGCALDAATRGLTVGLLEARDFASGTSSRSSKLIHGGLRYLEMLDFGLVREALRERGLLVQRLAPHLVRPIPFLYPLRHPGNLGRVRRGPAAPPAPEPRRRPARLPGDAPRLAGRRYPVLRRAG
jgi:glycerol-3-phosphate dehydrogenase